MEHDITKMLRDAVARKQAAKSDADVKLFAKEFSKELAGAISPDDISRSVENKIVSSLTPLIQQLMEKDQLSAETIKSAISQIKIPDVYINTSEINEAIREAFGSMSFPQPKVHVNVPPINVPEVRMPNEMNIKGWVSLMGVDLNHPLPVQLRDANGNPLKLFENLTTLISQGGGGGKHDFFTIKGFSASAYADYLNGDNRLRVSVETGGSGLTDTELRATSVPVEQVSGSMWSTAVVDIFGSTAASGVFNGDNRIKVSVETGGSGLTDAELRAAPVPVQQVSGYSDSVNVVSTVGLTDTQLRASSIPILQVSGAIDSVNVVTTVGLTDTQIRATSLPVEQVSGSNWSTSVTNTVTVTGTLTSTVAVGDIPSGTADTGSAPVKTGGIVRTANPTAEAGGDRVSSSYDDLGRQLIRPVQVRDLTVSAYASFSTGTEATLLAATAGSMHDLIYILASNNSTAAVGIDIRPVLAGNIVMHLEIPANGVVGVSTPVPIPQSSSDTGNAWTVDLPDITGTTVYVSALFSREV